MIDHDKALDLAADSLDFSLEDRDAAELASHLEGCADCVRYTALMKADETFLEQMTSWDSDDDGLQGDEYGPQYEDGYEPEEPEGRPESGADDDAGDDADDDDDDLSDDPTPPRDASRDDPGDRDDADDEDEDDEDDVTPAERPEREVDEDAESRAAREIGEDDEDEEDEEDEEDVTPVAARGEPDEESDPLEKFVDALVRDDEPGGGDEAGASGGGDEDAELEAMAAAMSDDELGSVDEDATDADAYVPPICAADGVEDAARENGARSGAAQRREAEEAVRNDEGLEKTDYGTVAVHRSVRGIVKGNRNSTSGHERLEVSAAAAAAIRNAILRSRTGRSGVERPTTRGRLDSKSVHRIAMRDPRLFKRLNAPAPGNYLVWILVDCSSSMSGHEIADAASVARALADASVGTPTVRFAVWGWSTPFMQRKYTTSFDNYARAGVAKVWESGQPTSEVFKLTDLPMGGTPDAAVMEWARQAIISECRSNEKPVIILASDGFGDKGLPAVVAAATKRGVIVRSVALGYGVNEARQEATFGRGNYVAWDRSILDTARPLATMIGRLAAGEVR